MSSTMPPAWPCAPEVVRSGGHVFRGLSALPARAPAQGFSCGKRGATVGCGVKECPWAFHAPCALFRSGGCVDEGNGESSNVLAAAARIVIKGRTAGCRAATVAARRRWKGPVDATGEPLQGARRAADQCAELGSSCAAPPDGGQGATSSASAVRASPRTRGAGATRRAPLGASVASAALSNCTCWNLQPRLAVCKTLENGRARGSLRCEAYCAQFRGLWVQTVDQRCA